MNIIDNNINDDINEIVEINYRIYSELLLEEDIK